MRRLVVAKGSIVAINQWYGLYANDIIKGLLPKP